MAAFATWLDARLKPRSNPKGKGVVEAGSVRSIPPIANSAMDGALGLLWLGKRDKDRSDPPIGFAQGRLLGDENKKGNDKGTSQGLRLA